MARAAAVGMQVIAVPRPEYPPDADALGAAPLVLSDLDHLTIEVVESLG